MTVYDSSVLIDYLEGDDDAVAYVDDHIDERAVAPSLVLFEIYQGEVFKSDPTDFAAVDSALEWLPIVDETKAFARAAGELQDELRHHGDPRAARDAFIAGAAVELDEPLVASDSDFDVSGPSERLEIERLV
ncbi:PIN domain-containing protein [Halopiger goleimassiliensis]|uniref:PIN domain-containing protein n=1 Tax=Halopiger goleimassiliensis TaxID=1293048 RepID=UPI000677A5AC|nr:PIN domain-containing protein [Halopiger goleimassiliensis]